MMILGTVAAAVKIEIADMNVEDEHPGMAALALSLARAVDSSAKNPAAKATAARELRAVMRELRLLAPVESQGGVVDDVGRKREERRRLLREQAAGG